MAAACTLLETGAALLSCCLTPAALLPSCPQAAISSEVLAEKERTIVELRETNEVRLRALCAATQHGLHGLHMLPCGSTGAELPDLLVLACLQALLTSKARKQSAVLQPLTSWLTAAAAAPGADP